MVKDSNVRFFMGLKFYCRLTFLFSFLLAILVGFKWVKYNKGLSKFTDLDKNDITNVSAKTVVIYSEKLEKPKLVLFYTPLFGRTPWPTIKNDHEFNNWNNNPCKERNCRISYNRQDLQTSDAVLFHGQDIDYLDLPKLSKTVAKRAKQRWVFFIHENPVFFTKDFRTLENVFNWTMTYKLDSDIFVPYSHYFTKFGKISGKDVVNSSLDHTTGKDRLVAWLVSHCGKQRDKLVKKLMEYIPVHVYGGCSPKFSQNRLCKRQDKNCLKTIRRYKFYLAFENANCVDYISEKYWITSLQNNIVPVVLGGGNYSNKNLAVPGSFINVMDFQSVKDLADYLIMLDRNDTAYNEYFSWKKRYYVDVPRSWTCQICSMLNNVSLPTKFYDLYHFEKFWGRRNNCRFIDEKVDKIISSNDLGSNTSSITTGTI